MTEPRLRRAGEADAAAIGDLVRAAYEGSISLLGRTPKPMLIDCAAAVREHDTWILEAEERALPGR